MKQFMKRLQKLEFILQDKNSNIDCMTVPFLWVSINNTRGNGDASRTVEKRI